MPIGLLLNTISFVVFYSSKTYKTSTGLHLMSLAIADNFVSMGLFFYNSSIWNNYINTIDFLNVNDIACKGIILFSVFSVFWSSMLLASATVERFISVAFALKAKRWNLLYVSKILLIVYVLASLLLSVALAYFRKITEIGEVKFCGTDEQYEQVFNVFVVGIYYVVSFGICSGLIVIFTFLTLFKAKRNQTLLSQTSNNNQSDNEFKITLMLFIVACLFIFTRIPILIVYEIILYHQSRQHYTSDVLINVVKVFIQLILEFVPSTMDELPSRSQPVNPSHVTLNGLSHYCTHNDSVNNSI